VPSTRSSLDRRLAPLGSEKAPSYPAFHYDPTMRPRSSPLWFDDDADFDRFRDTLTRLEFRDDAISTLLNAAPGTSIYSKGAGVLHTRTEGSPLGTLIRILLMGVPVPVADLARAVAPLTPASWQHAGLVTLDGDLARAAVQLLPLPGGRWLASDMPRRGAAKFEVAEDYVMSIGRSTTILGDSTIRRPSRATLDLGTGSGYHAVLAAPHSAQVVAIDRNPRAIGFARFNARINALNNVEAIEGDLFAPAAGRTFDLIVTNPPFVITPGKQFIYRDSGMSGDAVVETICRTAPAHLNDGGYGQMICNWAHLKGRDWKDRLRSWFAEASCDVWIMRSETLDAASYASFWIRHTVGPEADQPGGIYDEWLAEYNRLGIEAVSMGMIFMRKRSATRHWLRFSDEPARIAGPFGHHVDRGFCNADFLASLASDDDLLAARVRLAPDARATTELEPGPRDWVPKQTTLTLASGLCYSGSADGHMLKLLSECDGTRPLREPVERLARSLMRDASEITPVTLDIVRAMLEQGLLLAPDRT